MIFRKNQVVDYYDSRKIACGLILDTDDRRLRILTEQAKESNISVSRILISSYDPHFPFSGNRDQQVSRLKELSRQRDELKNQINLRELWEVVGPETGSVGIEDLAELSFGRSRDMNSAPSLLRAIQDDRIYFKILPDRIEVPTPDRVQQALNQREKERGRADFMAKSAEFLVRLREGEGIRADSAPEGLIEMLEEAAGEGAEWVALKPVREIFSRAGLPQGWDPFRVLVKLGIWSEDENITLRIEDVPVEFSPEAEAQALDDARKSMQPPDRELLQEEVITIDAVSTRDVDDALSLRHEGDEAILGVHITDVAHLIDPDTLLDHEIRRRATSIYLPESTIPMIPPVLSEKAASLEEGAIRPVISVLMRLGRDFELKDYTINESNIRVSQRLSYESVDRKILDSNSSEATFFRIAIAFRKERVAQGALIFKDPELSVHVTEDKKIEVGVRERESPSQILVSELMIQANRLFAQFLEERKIPAFFRSQPAPLERISLGNEYDPVTSYRSKKALARSNLTTEPGPHSTLGLTAYATATSPLRRYTDLIVQRQLKAVLKSNAPLLNLKELESILEQVSYPLERAALMERQRQRYFLLKYLEQRRHEEWEAIVLHRFPGFHLVQLTRFFLNAALHTPNNLVLAPYDRAIVQIEKINPRDDKLILSLVKLL
jgi:exoribonuclease II